MTKKIRMIMTQIIEYEPDVNNYVDVKTYEEMADIDAHTDDIEALFDTVDAELNITWEIVERLEDGDYGLCNSKEHWERTGKVTKIENQKEELNEEKTPYCINCGNDDFPKNFKYEDHYANGYKYVCKDCGNTLWLSEKQHEELFY